MRQNLPAVLKRAARRRVTLRKAAPGSGWAWEVHDKHTTMPCRTRAEAIRSLKLRRLFVAGEIKTILRSLQSYGLKLFIKL